MSRYSIAEFVSSTSQKDRGEGLFELESDRMLEVNLSGETGKGGVSPNALPELLAASTAWSHLTISGLMTLPAVSDDPETARPVFAQLRRLSESLRSAAGGRGLRELSMGMSADFEIAIEEGATIVRIGTAIFGPRSDTGE